jgi:Fe-S-cluster containining protein
MMMSKVKPAAVGKRLKKDQLHDLTRIEFDDKQGRFVFHGDCIEMHPICQAMCCSQFTIEISSEEYASGQYEAEIVCLWTYKSCQAAFQSCPSQRYQLIKQRNKSCIYQKDKHCSIYNRRPRICRDFVCSGAYLLWSKPEPSGLSDQKPPTLNRETFLEHLNEDMVFLQHPLIKVHTIFNIVQKREIIFVKEMVGACGKFTTRDNFNYPQLGDDQILLLLELFKRNQPLCHIYRHFCTQSSISLSKSEFSEIIWLLNKHNIILNSRNFQGMLGGIGAIR